MSAFRRSISAWLISKSLIKMVWISIRPPERKIENFFFREDFRRVYLDEIGAIEVLSNADVLDEY